MSSGNLHWLDIVVGLTLLGGVVLGLLAGFKRIVLRLVHFALSIGLAILLFRPVGKMVQAHAEGAAGGLAKIAVAAGLFLAIHLALWMCFAIIRKAISRSTAAAGQHVDQVFRAAGLHPLDRILGATAGGLLAFAPLTVLFTALYLSPQMRDAVEARRSIVGPGALRTIDSLIDSIPQEQKDRIAESVERAKQAVTNKLADELGTLADEVARRAEEEAGTAANGQSGPQREEIRQAIGKLLNVENPAE